MRLRLGIALLSVCVGLVAHTPATAAGSAVQAPATVVFPEVVLPVAAGPRVVVTFLNTGGATVRFSPPAGCRAPTPRCSGCSRGARSSRSPRASSCRPSSSSCRSSPGRTGPSWS